MTANQVCQAVVLLAVLLLTDAAPAGDNISGRVRRALSENNSVCRASYPLLCTDGILCVKRSQLCDGLSNCIDGSDEEGCSGGGDAGCSSASPKTKGHCSNPTANVDCNSGLDNLRTQLVNSHNYYRCLHGVPTATVATDLITSAQAWANHLAATNGEGHSDRGQNPPSRGENIWTGYDARLWQQFDQFTGEVPVANWYSEKQYYDFTRQTSSGSRAGHFTQLIWRASTEIGCGAATEDRQYGPKFFIVCHYRKAGNTVNFSENVPPPLSL